MASSATSKDTVSPKTSKRNKRAQRFIEEEKKPVTETFLERKYTRTTAGGITVQKRSKSQLKKAFAHVVGTYGNNNDKWEFLHDQLR